MIDISSLNENQKKAVLADSKYLRIIAGAGSGKTRVLTMRIVHLIQDLHIEPYHILAITFTNKAANEMKQRIQDSLEKDAPLPWVSTIHSLCVRILREDIHVMNWPKNFTVLDAEDQKQILREAYRELDVDKKAISFASSLDYISSNKCAGITVAGAKAMASGFNGDEIKARIYEFYVNRQKELWALDFDDLILYTVKMFNLYEEVLHKWQRRFHYIHVDEFQDIDHVQYTLIKQLTGLDNHLYVVGDPDQTIYTWRGADVSIIMNFTKDFEDTETITLNQNYRSTTCILNGANAVIKNNKNRLKKDLFSNRESEEKITHYVSAADEYEAAWIAEKIKRLHREGKAYHDIALLYRSNYLSRSLEKGLLDAQIPYVIYGGVRFYERQEVKDVLAYLKLAVNGDDLSFKRIINTPRRGIGTKTVDAIEEQAHKDHSSMLEVLYNHKISSGKTQLTLTGFTTLMDSLREKVKNGTDVVELLEKIIEESGLRKMYEDAGEPERIENMKELVDDAKEFLKTYPESTMEEYLQLVALYGDREETMASDYVQLMTVHAAKGLEFDTVFVTDMNEGIFPSQRAVMDMKLKGIEEERRLAYVAFTRAKNKLYITEAGGFSYILQTVRNTSRFIKEIDEAYIEHLGLAKKKEEPTSFFFDEPSCSHNGEPSSNAKPAGKKFKKGDIAVHTKFGEGIVIDVDGQYVSIAFSYPYGVKKVAANHPTLSKKES